MFVRRWFERLSNWQFVAALATVLILAIAIVDCITALIFRQLDLTFLVTSGVLWTVAVTSVRAWARWR